MKIEVIGHRPENYRFKITAENGISKTLAPNAPLYANQAVALAQELNQEPELRTFLFTSTEFPKNYMRVWAEDEKSAKEFAAMCMGYTPEKYSVKEIT
jgi:hypothetical protein